jgi:hypothetical protein
MKSELSLNFITRKDTAAPEFGRALLNVLANCYPNLTPELYDTRPERGCRNPFIGIEEAIQTWAPRGVTGLLVGGKLTDASEIIGHNYIKRKSNIKYYASINHTSKNRFGNPIFGLIGISFALNRKENWLGLFGDLAEIVDPVLARAHIFTDIEIKGHAFGSPQKVFWAGPSQPEMREGLTNLAWANIFSEEYASEVDETALRSHGYAVEHVGGGKLFTVTDNIFDVVDDFPKFSARRAELKSLFRPDLFRITDEPSIPPKA